MQKGVARPCPVHGDPTEPRVKRGNVKERTTRPVQPTETTETQASSSPRPVEGTQIIAGLSMITLIRETVRLGLPPVTWTITSSMPDTVYGQIEIKAHEMPAYAGMLRGEFVSRGERYFGTRLMHNYELATMWQQAPVRLAVRIQVADPVKAEAVIS